MQARDSLSLVASSSLPLAARMLVKRIGGSGAGCYFTHLALKALGKEAVLSSKSWTPVVESAL